MFEGSGVRTENVGSRRRCPLGVCCLRLEDEWIMRVLCSRSVEYECKGRNRRVLCSKGLAAGYSEDEGIWRVLWFRDLV